MINSYIIHPKRIVVVGGSNNLSKPGGNALMNLKRGTFSGEIYVVNNKEVSVQGFKSYPHVRDIPSADLAIISVPATLCIETITLLAQEKNVKAFIVFSAGFSEESEQGALLEKELLRVVQTHNVCLIGPNCSGMFNMFHQSIFTQPIPLLQSDGVDMVSASGGTATFIIEAAFKLGVRFHSVWSVGNATQNGVEEILEYWDTSFCPTESSRIKLLYIENIRQPRKFLQHTSSLIAKGCHIVALKSGVSESGSRAASSHTGAIAGSDIAVDALFRKAGIIRCHSRQEMINVCAVLSQKPLKGKNIGIISQAGGPAVILTDALSAGGLNVPLLDQEKAALLKQQLLPGTATTNPIDLLGTGTADHLDKAISHCLNHHPELDALAVLYGNPGVGNVEEAYRILAERLASSPIPIYPIMPSVVMATKEMEEFIAKGNVCYHDEAILAKALSLVINRQSNTYETSSPTPSAHISQIRHVIQGIKQQEGWLSPEDTRALLQAGNIPMVKEFVSHNKEEIMQFASEIGFPVVLKVVGIVHKSDVGGVIVNIQTEEQLSVAFDKLMQIPNAQSVLLQPMLSGQELFIGAKYEEEFGYIVLCGLGGIFVDILKDVSYGLAPLSEQEARIMVRSLKSYPLIQGARGQKGINEQAFIDIIVRFSQMLPHAQEVKEIDLNPLLATEESITAVDARIYIKQQ